MHNIHAHISTYEYAILRLHMRTHTYKIATLAYTYTHLHVTYTYTIVCTYTVAYTPLQMYKSPSDHVWLTARAFAEGERGEEFTSCFLA
ncbi:hypothetical protein GCM10007377_16370 [Galliscardovia ingluviei]|uniref:Uncharacterized protein n=1 Tax=Galliscardovia ingluviei TaxID=1769422 RepID=A0A8J3AMN7_9BIFI|nr:hypothetical protein GCM10007377_16370 [Galliscardovia ingluviei]